MSLTGTYVPPHAIPCKQCVSEYLLDRHGQPLCGLGKQCELWAFVQQALKAGGERERPAIQRRLRQLFDASYVEEDEKPAPATKPKKTPPRTYPDRGIGIE